jgi:ATP-dependent helicase HrpA
LLGLKFGQQAKMISQRLKTRNMPLLARAVGGLDLVADELVLATIVDLVGGNLPRDADAFASLAESIRGDLVPCGEKLADVLTQTLELHPAVRARLDAVTDSTRDDIADQLDHLVFPGFVSLATAEWLVHYPRYLTAIDRRLDAVEQGKFARDERLARDVRAYWQRWFEFENERGVDAMRTPDGRTLRFMIEEYRVSLFAQPLGTAQRVSPRRLDTLFAAVGSQH